MTATQWREIYDRTRRGVGEMQGSGSGAPSCINAADIACGTGGTDMGSAMAGGT
jgi:hypothetical protein